MIKLREFYSDVYTKDDDKAILRCKSCNSEFPPGDILLCVPDEMYDEDEITEHCPVCSGKI
jgi:hypothetical protein